MFKSNPKPTYGQWTLGNVTIPSGTGKAIQIRLADNTHQIAMQSKLVQGSVFIKDAASIQKLFFKPKHHGAFYQTPFTCV